MSSPDFQAAFFFPVYFIPGRKNSLLTILKFTNLSLKHILVQYRPVSCLTNLFSNQTLTHTPLYICYLCIHIYNTVLYYTYIYYYIYPTLSQTKCLFFPTSVIQNDAIHCFSRYLAQYGLRETDPHLIFLIPDVNQKKFGQKSNGKFAQSSLQHFLN